jgi:hypothetical protein
MRSRARGCQPQFRRDVDVVDSPTEKCSMTGALAVQLGSAAAWAQATVDTENRYPNVGVIMVWGIDDSGKPVELRGFASGTLIRPHVMITPVTSAAPVKALGGIPPTIRIYASFSAMDARDPGPTESCRAALGQNRTEPSSLPTRGVHRGMPSSG